MLLRRDFKLHSPIKLAYPKICYGGLMPILTSLTDSKRLTLPNLDGLGRLMDLLTNHFNVEIRNKLIDCHRQLADKKTLREAIQKVARLTDIFHRLPHPGAHIFLKDLADNVIASEAIMNSQQGDLYIFYGCIYA
jgi:transformation/transcription domain-associated protein